MPAFWGRPRLQGGKLPNENESIPLEWLFYDVNFSNWDTFLFPPVCCGVFDLNGGFFEACENRKICGDLYKTSVDYYIKYGELVEI